MILLEIALLVFGFMTLFFLIALIKKDNSVVDFGWGLGFVLVAVYSFLRFGGYEFGFGVREFLVSFFVVIWGIRLSMHILARNWGKGEDFRYAKWRKDWGKWFIFRSFFQIFMLQGLLMLLIAIPVIFVNGWSWFGFGVIEFGGWLDWLGVCVWVLGFVFEALGDYQLGEFVRLKKLGQTKNKIMTEGLWRYTRHPNYFGEVVMWWGIFLMTLNLIFYSPWALLTLISPLLITFLIAFVSGIPMLEEKYAKDAEFLKYKKSTSAFFPWFVRE